MKWKSRILAMIALVQTSLSIACEKEEPITYPPAQNLIEIEVDDLLGQSEHLLFQGEFSSALATIERVENFCTLPSLADQRKLRILLDKAIIFTCLNGPTEESSAHFAHFEKCLQEKSCHHQNVEMISGGKKNWPITGPDSMSPEECSQTVENMIDFASMAAAALPVSRKVLFSIETTLQVLGRQAKRCCTEHGFWKTCMQPLVDAAKNMKHFGIPPDPAWD
jgi:hypothetical protein